MNEVEVKDLKKLCKKYIKNILFAAKLNELAGCIIYCSANNDRIDIHEEICQVLGISHNNKNMKEITDNLDKSIGLCTNYDYDDSEIDLFAERLQNKLRNITEC